MSAEAAVVSRIWRVGERTVTMTIQRPEPGRASHATCEWEPDAPKALSGPEWAQYRAGRDAAIAEMAAELGLNVAVLDV